MEGRGGRTNRIEKINGESCGWSDEMPVLPPAFARHARIASGNARPEDLKPIQMVSDQGQMITGLSAENEALKNGLAQIRAQYDSLNERMAAPMANPLVAKQNEEIELLKATNSELMDRMSQLATAMEALMGQHASKKK